MCYEMITVARRRSAITLNLHLRALKRNGLTVVLVALVCPAFIVT